MGEDVKPAEDCPLPWAHEHGPGYSGILAANKQNVIACVEPGPNGPEDGDDDCIASCTVNHAFIVHCVERIATLEAQLGELRRKLRDGVPVTWDRSAWCP